MKKNDFCVAIIGDVHFGVRGSSKIFHQNTINFFRRTVDSMLTRGVDTMILLGDVFENRKMVNFDTLYECKRGVFDMLLENNIKVYTIAGNHDVYYKNSNHINSLELLLPSSEYPNVTHVTNEATEIEIHGNKFLFVPWVNKENYDSIGKVVDDSLARYMVAHLDMAGFEMHKGAISDRGHFEADRLHKFEMVLTGHYHTKSSRGNIHYLGTPYQTSWNDYGEEKGFHYLTNEGLEFVKNEDCSFYKFVYRDADGVPTELVKEIKETDLRDKYVRLIVKSKRNLKLFEQFVELIESKNPADLNILDETNFVNESNEEVGEMTDTVTTIANFINDELETSLDKQRLMTSLASLYQMAIELTDGD